MKIITTNKSSGGHDEKLAQPFVVGGQRFVLSATKVSVYIRHRTILAPNHVNICLGCIETRNILSILLFDRCKPCHYVTNKDLSVNHITQVTKVQLYLRL